MATTGSGADIEELVKRITSHRGVRGFLIINNEGIAIRHSFTEASRELAVQYAALFQPLAISAKTVLQEIDNNNELQVVRLRTKKDEIIVAPDSKYMLVIIQDAEMDKVEAKK
ncbi:putative Roadblock/LC7 domain containing protein [Leishmania naiffi]|uniref:Dynein light chain roadblock n=3 Tax=Viannia TaxID=37616 RepID=A0AAW3APH3_9TRYP